jgi:hypothetical protein
MDDKEVKTESTKEANPELFAYDQERRTDNQRLTNRETLYRLFNERPLPDEQLMVSLGLYMRSSALTKILYINELYEQILDIPGVVLEFGTWWGQNLVLFENLRAIYEPFNHDRRIVGFDTFEGYPSISENDKKSGIIKEGGYTTTNDYDHYLDSLIEYHEKENVLFFERKHQLVRGDVSKTVPEFFLREPHTVVALAYFDLALYEPSKVCFETIRPHLIRGSVIALDEINNPAYPGETIALKETWGLNFGKIVKSRFMPGRAYLVVE